MIGGSWISLEYCLRYACKYLELGYFGFRNGSFFNQFFEVIRRKFDVKRLFCNEGCKFKTILKINELDECFGF